MKAKKILETAKLQDTFWGKIIIASEKRGHFTVHKKELSRKNGKTKSSKVTKHRYEKTPLRNIQAYSKVSGLQNSTEYKRTNQLVIQVMTERRWPTPTAIDMKGEAQPLTEEGKQKRIDFGKAGDWITCACGKLDNNIPRFSDGDPIDPYLREYGKLFEASVLDCDFAKAAQLLCKIEKRSAKILSENIDEDPLSRY